MKWFRFYVESLDDPKVQRLSPHLFKFWINALSIAASIPHRGTLPSVSELAFRLRISEERAVIGVDELVARALIDRSSHDGMLSIHNWDKWQPESDDAAERMRNIRRTRSEHVPARREEIRIDTEVEEKREDDTPLPPSSSSLLDEGWDAELYKAYEEAIGSLSAPIAELVTEASQEYGDECVLHSLEAMTGQGKRSWKYAEAIMRRHKAEGCAAVTA